MKMAFTPCLAASQSTQRFWSYKFPFVSKGPFLQDRTLFFKLIIFLLVSAVCDHTLNVCNADNKNLFFKTA